MADEDFHSLIRTQGTQATRLGSDIESRFWLSYRPYESKNVAREWFLGPVLTWLHSQNERVAGVTQSGSGGDVLLAGITTYVGVRPGMHVWLGMDWDVAHATGATFMPVRRHISFGITQQFGLHFEERRNDENHRTRAGRVAWSWASTRVAGADQAHRNARRRHDLKLLSIRGEATPRAPVWRSKRGSQLARRKSGSPPQGRGAD